MVQPACILANMFVCSDSHFPDTLVIQSTVIIYSTSISIQTTHHSSHTVTVGPLLLDLYNSLRNEIERQFAWE